MEQKVDIKAIGKYDGHGVKGNKSVDLKFKLRYSELTKAIQLLQLLNVDIKLTVKLDDEKPKGLGLFRLQEVKVDHDGESAIKLNSSLDYIEADGLNNLIGEVLALRFIATVEVEEEDEEEE